jgi:alkyl sulfatase BDS1-like metallo-beta-lactamase superfamily hydrolase
MGAHFGGGRVGGFSGARVGGPILTVLALAVRPDTKDKYLVVVQYGVLQYHKDQQAKDADASLTMNRDTLNEIIGG